MAVTVLAAATPARAADPEPAAAVQFALDYTLDVAAVDAGRSGSDHYLLDNLNLTAEADLNQLIGWNGGTAHVDVLNNLGGMPNQRAATLQGIDNIEVGTQRLRLFEAWLEQRIGARASARVGLYDMNSEFYSNDAAGALLAPAFGVGSEIAATGPNGPSIFPSTALALRLESRIGRRGYARAAIINADARTIGDPHGVDISFHSGGLLIAEAGIDHGSKVAVGAWTYTRQHDDLRETRADGSPVQRSARGGYAIVQHPLNDPAGPRATQAFVRVGVSDGHTTPFRGGWQAGLLVNRPIAGRPESLFSIGANQAYLTDHYRQRLADEGITAARAESAIEITYADTIVPHVRLQPDVQWVLRPAGDRGRDDVIAFTLRLGVSY
jgi:porin